jgi:enoyl-CoA hydratase
VNEELVTRRQGETLHLLINRPERSNALSRTLVDRLLEVLHAATHDGTRLVVFRGSGKSFCAGFDLGSVHSESSGDLALRFIRIEQLLQLLYHYPVETVVLGQGRIYGAGADLFCSCSHRICAPGATFRFPGARFGIVLGTRRFAARVGADIAGTAVLRGRELSARDAISSGLATQELSEDFWDALVDDHARDVEMVAPKTTRFVLNSLRPDTRDADMASLVASVSEPGLRDRICAYRDQISKGRQWKTG